MNKTQLKEKINFEDVNSLKLNGEEFSSEFIKSTILARIWRSATVVKNKRESDKGGVKATISQALSAELITADEALPLLLVGDAKKIAELKAQLPQVEKSEEPSEEDVEIAIKQVLANKGQAS